MNDINRVFIIARLTKDPELRTTQGGTSVASFSVANNRSYTTNGDKKEDVSYFNCVAWGKLGEIIAQHCKKGARIGIEGRLQQRRWQDKEGKNQNTIEIVVENLQFLDGKASTTTVIGQEVPASDVGSVHFSDAEIPFF